MSIINIAEFAKAHHTDYCLFERVIRNGQTNTDFSLVDGIYYAEESVLYQLFINNIFAPPDNYITLPQFAQDHNIDSQRLRKLVEKGWLKTAVRYRRKWFIDKAEKIVVSNDLILRKHNNEKFLENLDKLEGKISAKEYAELHNVTEKEIITLIKEGLLRAFTPARGHYYLEKDEPFVHYVNIMQYTRLHKLTYAQVYSAVISGQLKSAIKRNKKWFLLPSDTCDFLNNQK